MGFWQYVFRFGETIQSQLWPYSGEVYPKHLTSLGCVAGIEAAMLSKALTHRC